MSNMTSKNKIKILILGEASIISSNKTIGVGKTAVLGRYITNKFEKSYINTVGVDFRSKNVDIKGDSFCLNV